MPKKNKFVKVYVPDDYDGIHIKEELIKIQSLGLNYIIIIARKREEIDPKNIVNQLVGCGQYQNNMFYKIASMCRKDAVWDYYRLLKKHPYQEVAIKTE